MDSPHHLTRRQISITTKRIAVSVTVGSGSSNTLAVKTRFNRINISSSMYPNALTNDTNKLLIATLSPLVVATCRQYAGSDRQSCHAPALVSAAPEILHRQAHDDIRCTFRRSDRRQNICTCHHQYGCRKTCCRIA